MVFFFTLQLEAVLGRHHLVKTIIWRNLLYGGVLEMLLYYRQKTAILDFLRNPGLQRCLVKL